MIALFTARVKSLYPKFTMAERKVADYLIMNGDEIEDVTSRELARRLDVGQSTVMRFSKKMGYSMFGEMIADIKSSGDLSTEIQNGDGLFTVMSKVEAKYHELLKSVIRSNREEDLGSAAHLVDAADTIICYGCMESGLLASHLCWSLVGLGKSAYCDADIIQTKRRLRMLDPTRDLVIVVSKSGDKSEPVGMAKAAVAEGIPLLAICDASDNPLSRVATSSLRVIEIADRSTPMTSMGVDAGVMLMIDTLIASVYQQDRKKYAASYRGGIVAAFSERRE